MPSKNKEHKNGKKYTSEKPKQPLIFKEDMEEYAQIEKMLGSGKVNLVFIDKTTCLGCIPGRMRGRMKKRNLISVGDVVLVSLRSFQETKCDIIHVYDKGEVAKLFSHGEIPPTFLDKSHTEENENDDVTFIDDEVSSIFEFNDI